MSPSSCALAWPRWRPGSFRAGFRHLAGHGAIATTEHPSLLRRASHFETRRTAVSASLSSTPAGRLRRFELRLHTLIASLRAPNRTSQSRGAPVLTEASQLHLSGVHGAVYPGG